MPKNGLFPLFFTDSTKLSYKETIYFPSLELGKYVKSVRFAGFLYVWVKPYNYSPTGTALVTIYISDY